MTVRVAASSFFPRVIQLSAQARDLLEIGVRLLGSGKQPAFQRCDFLLKKCDPFLALLPQGNCIEVAAHDHRNGTARIRLAGASSPQASLIGGKHLPPSVTASAVRVNHRIRESGFCLWHALSHEHPELARLSRSKLKICLSGCVCGVSPERRGHCNTRPAPRNRDEKAFAHVATQLLRD